MNMTFTLPPRAPEISLRRALALDAAALTRLGIRTFHETFGDLYSIEDTQSYLNATFCERIQQQEFKDSVFWVVESGGEPIAYLKAGRCKLPIESEEDAAEIQRLYVQQDHHGKGYGPLLMQSFYDWAAESNAPAAYLGVYEGNLKAQKFYARYGFTEVGEYQFAVGKHFDRELILKKVL